MRIVINIYQLLYLINRYVGCTVVKVVTSSEGTCNNCLFVEVFNYFLNCSFFEFLNFEFDFLASNS